jgi:uncharacterized protein YneF (UPF0154 family)
MALAALTEKAALLRPFGGAVGAASQQARRELMQDLEIAGGTIKETAKTAAKVAGGVALALMSESESSKKRRIQREAIRAQLEAKGIKPTEDQIDKILNAR